MERKLQSLPNHPLSYGSNYIYTMNGARLRLGVMMYLSSKEQVKNNNQT